MLGGILPSKNIGFSWLIEGDSVTGYVGGDYVIGVVGGDMSKTRAKVAPYLGFKKELKLSRQLKTQNLHS